MLASIVKTRVFSKSTVAMTWMFRGRSEWKVSASTMVMVVLSVAPQTFAVPRTSSSGSVVEEEYAAPSRHVHYYAHATSSTNACDGQNINQCGRSAIAEWNLISAIKSAGITAYLITRYQFGSADTGGQGGTGVWHSKMQVNYKVELMCHDK